MASRTGSARVFFEVVGSFQAQRLLKDVESTSTVMQAILLDAAGGVVEAVQFAVEGVSDLIQEQIDSFYAFEEQMIQIRKFYQGNEEDILQFAEASKMLGETFAFSGAEALKAAANMAQMKSVLGSKEAVIEGTRMGLLFAEIGNMETQEGMKKLTSLMQQTHFHMGGLTKAQYDLLDPMEQANVIRGNTIRVLDQLNTIENSSVATMQDMTFVLNQFASQANLAGESMGSMAALAAMLLEAGEETSRAGTGLRMIFSRLAVDGGDASLALAEVIPHLEAQEISMMSLTEIITELTPYYKELSDLEKVRLAQAVAGNRHYVKLQKLLENQERLLTLNEMAYSGAYTAADEFANRQASDVFKIDKANAAIENLRVEVGDNLVDAYIRAMGPQYYFLQGLEKITDEETKIGGLFVGKRMNTFMANLMFLAETMQQMEVPINFVMGIGNIYVSMKTLQVILKQTNQMENMHTEAFQRRLFMREQDAALRKKFAHEEIQSIKDIQAAEMGRINQTIRDINIQKANAASSKASHERAIDRIHQEVVAMGQIDSYKKQLRSNELMMDKEYRMQKIAEHNEMLILKDGEAQALMRIRTVQEEVMRGQLDYYTLGAGFRANQQKEQKQFLGHIKREADYLANHIVLFTELTEDELNHLAVRQQANNERMLTEQLLLAEARRRLELDDLSEEETMNTITEINLREENIRAMGEERVGIEGLVNANDQLKQRNQATALTLNTLEYHMDSLGDEASLLTATFLYFAETQKYVQNQMFGTAEATKTTINSMMSSMNGLLGMTAMFTHNQDLMNASLIGGTIVNAGASASMWAVGKSAEGMATRAILARGAMLALGGGIAAIVALGVGKLIWDRFKPTNDFMDSINEITDVTDGLNDFHTTLTDLSKKGDVAVDEALLGGITFNDLRADAQLTASSLASLQKEFDYYTELSEDVDNYTDAELIALETKAGYYNRLTQEVSALNDAHVSLATTESRIANQAVLFAGQRHTGARTAEQLYDENLWTNLFKQFDATEQESIIANILDGLYDEHPEYLAQWFKGDYWTIPGHEGFFSTEEEMLERLVEINGQSFDQVKQDAEAAGLAVADYYSNLLVQVGGSVNMFGDATGTALEALNEFDSKREELFFGNQAQFQGAIYRQITQGGVESLLHRVEIMQTNVFNGVTLDEAIDRVSEGVIMNLRGQGVPV